MQKDKVEVKSKGNVLGTIDVPVYEAIKEAVGALGEDKVLALINRQTKADMMNEFRAAHTREASPTSKLARIAKSDPEAMKDIQNLLKKYGVELPG